MSAISPAPPPEVVTVAAAESATETPVSGDTPTSPYAHSPVKTKEPEPPVAVVKEEEETAGEEEGSPINPPPITAEAPKVKVTPQRNRAKSRRLSFADEMEGGKLTETTYHTNLHYAQQQSDSSASKKNNQEGGCCTIS